MKKIMFNDRYDLTQAVIEGRKTQTRRIVPQSVIEKYSMMEDPTIIDDARYDVGEIVAVAQSYLSIVNALENDNNATCAAHYEKNVEKAAEYTLWMEHPGFNNKMFVRADHMPNKIRITDVRVERLQDISDRDCLAEGIIDMGIGGSLRYSFDENVKQTTGEILPFSNNFATAKEAFAHLIDKVCGRGTWERNPLVWVYDFELVK